MAIILHMLKRKSFIRCLFDAITRKRIKENMIRQDSELIEVELYIAGFPANTQNHLKLLRSIIREAAPAAEELISYQMPAYKYYGMLTYFAGYKNHIGFYPGASGITNFKNEITQYKSAKGSVQFPLDQPLPVELIKKIVTFRVKENLAKAELKAKKKT